ncbi:protein pafC [Mycobacterium xenopi 4042]|uniref:Protein pafC n=1 Tax=Mycobacterium xenopi 4042 TaxID=1299334 RepID=X8BG07_MYCXE|nr:protein pafC [Mycobacterium xenopi 4042]
MVPYFQANPRVTRAKAAADLGVTVKQLEEDINQLWLCGLPGYGPGDLIDFEFSGDTIEVTFSAGIDRPLQLTSPEATGLLVALRALADVPGLVDPEAARSAIAKIESAAGTAAHGTHASAVEDPAPPKARPRPRFAPRYAATGRWPLTTTLPRTTRCPAGSSTRFGCC